ncbi:skin secretory protein xP2-like [Amphibalanus amphitrite]|uniref:skin secretory protein xP2-like n=1 Tax=Amphibalanus amphitrite TaxID=1232801 RepID=UPI001C91DE1E|nr:skin secretory protein xP2-like [Amphibalanus amphitrite]
MDGVPVKISELCRPPTKVHLPAPLRALPPSELPAQPITFELETKALHWVQERRRNLLSERTGRTERLHLKEQAQKRRREEQARRLAEEQEQRRRQEEEQLRREEQERLEEFRRKKQQANTAESTEATASGSDTSPAVPATAPVNAITANSTANATTTTNANATATAPAAAPSPPPVAADAPATATNHVTSTDPENAADPAPALANAAVDPSHSHHSRAPGLDASSSAAAAVGRPAAAAPATDARPSPTVVSSNPFNPFAGAAAAMLQPQTWRHQQAAGASAQRPASFNYRDFESQASDPFDSAELKTINDMEELASVFRPPAAAATSQPRLEYPGQQSQQTRPAAGTHSHQYHAPAAAAASAGGYSFSGAYSPYPSAAYSRPAYSGAPAKPAVVESPPYRYPGGGYVPPAARPNSLAAEAPVPAPPQPDARQLQEFYARYYGPPAGAGARLRSSRSEPDLSEPTAAAADAGPDSDGGAARRTKSHTPPPAPSSGGAPPTQEWPWQRPERPAETAPDPLHGLEPAVRARLQELAQMGFPLDRLRRLHTQFDGDEKQVIEFCLSAQRLEEAGHAPLAAERGLLECDGDLGRAADFLSSLTQLTGLGFPEQRAADALRRCDMNRDRALDMLVQR